MGQRILSNGLFAFAAAGTIPAARCGIVGAMYLYYVALFVFYYALTGDKISVSQAHLASRRKAEVPFWRIFAEVILLDIEVARERHLPRSRACVFGIVHSTHLFYLILRTVVNHTFHRTPHSHHP